MGNDSIEKLAQYFSRFPGIGERQSKRFVYYLLRQNPSYLNDLSALIRNIKQLISQCSVCKRNFSAENKTICEYCASQVDHSLLIVLEKEADYESFRRTSTYSGGFFLLGGLVPILEKNPERLVRSEELITRIQKELDQGLTEVILAFSLTPQGDYTDEYVRELLKQFSESHDLKISSLGRGLSTGSELEYLDPTTLESAMQNRK